MPSWFAQDTLQGFCNLLAKLFHRFRVSQHENGAQLKDVHDLWIVGRLLRPRLGSIRWRRRNAVRLHRYRWYIGTLIIGQLIQQRRNQ